MLPNPTETSVNPQTNFNDPNDLHCNKARLKEYKIIVAKGGVELMIWKDVLEDANIVGSRHVFSIKYNETVLQWLEDQWIV